MNTLERIDVALFRWINGWNDPFLDAIMIGLSDKYIWIPLYLLLIYRLFRIYSRQVWIPVLALILIITVTDQLTSSVMKPFFERLRPCKDPSLLDFIVVVDGCGGKYGFVSSHAANTMGLATFFIFLERKSTFSLLLGLWALLVGLSRVYLGVHFPGDVIAGFLVGGLISSVIYFAFRKFMTSFYS